MSELTITPSVVSDLGDTVGQNAKAYIDALDEVTAIVDGLSSVWGGETYDLFSSTYHTNLGNLQELNSVLKEMSDKLNDSASQGENMINNISNIVGQ